MTGYYDRNGQPISLYAWASAFDAERHVGNDKDIDGSGVDVSTVWLGIDHRFGDGPPLIFETIIRLTDHAAIYVHDPAVCDRIAEVATRAAAELREAQYMAGPLMAEEARR